MLLAITHLLALAILAYHPFWWVPLDVASFVADGAAQSRTSTFHAQRWRWRCGLVVLVSLAASLPLWGQWGRLLLSAAGLSVLGGGWFFFAFTPALNIARHLDYITKFHVSWAIEASWPDRKLWYWAWARVRLPAESVLPHYPRPDVVKESGRLLRIALWATLGVTATIYAAIALWLLLA